MFVGRIIQNDMISNFRKKYYQFDIYWVRFLCWPSNLFNKMFDDLCKIPIGIFKIICSFIEAVIGSVVSVSDR